MRARLDRCLPVVLLETTIFAPHCARPRAMAKPIPVVEPVRAATLSDRSKPLYTIVLLVSYADQVSLRTSMDHTMLRSHGHNDLSKLRTAFQITMGRHDIVELECLRDDQAAKRPRSVPRLRTASPLRGMMVSLG